MSTRMLRTIVGVGLGVVLVSAPAVSLAERIPSRPVTQLFLDNDPRVPDNKDPNRALASNESAVLDSEVERTSDRRSSMPMRPENWLIRVFRLINRLGWGGLVR